MPPTVCQACGIFFLSLQRTGPFASNNKEAIASVGKPTEVILQKALTVYDIKLVVYIKYFFKYSYLLNRNSKFNILYMEFD